MRKRIRWRSAQQRATDFFRPMLTRSFWKRHDEPFAKRRAGRLRRDEKRFRAQCKMECLE